MKILDTLYARAKRTGEGNLNGRKRYDSGRIGHLEERYNITIESGHLTLRHWGTETLIVNLIDKKVVKYYGESNSDRDSMNYILSLVGIEDIYFRYRPSLNEFSMGSREVILS